MDKLEHAETAEEKLEILKESRRYIQSKLAESQPQQAVLDMPEFFRAGPETLSEMFEYLVKCSKEGDLSKLACDQIPKVTKVIEEYLVKEGNETLEQELIRKKDGYYDSTGNNDMYHRKKDGYYDSTGNNVMYQVILFHELSKLFKEKGSKLFFY